jgi:2-octaprenyl-6-methoxyphenol hydroxylase
MEDLRCDVIVVGGGIIGLTSALSLADIGLRVILLEKRDLSKVMTSSFDNRVSAISYGSWKLLSSIGVANSLEQNAGPINQIRVTDENSKQFLHFDNASLDVVVPLGFMVSNEELVKALYEKVTNHENISLISPASYTNIIQLNNKIHVTLDNNKIVKGCLLIAADGKNSAIRDIAGINYTRVDAKQSAIVFNIEHEFSHNQIAVEHFYPGGPFAVLPMKNPNQSCIVWSESHSVAKLIHEKLNKADLDWQHKLGDYLGEAKVLNKSVLYKLEVIQARKYCNNRIALIGDAAHHIHPVAGQGANLGFLDISALVEVVAKAYNLGLDIGSEFVLAEYQKARKGNNKLMVSMTGFLVTLFSNDILGLSIARKLGLGIVNKLPRLKTYFMQ